MELPQSRYQTRPQSRQGALKKPNNYNFQQEWKIFQKPCLPPTFNGLVSAQTDVSSLSPSPHPLVLQDTGATMSSNPRRQSHNGSQQQASTSNTQYGYQVQPGGYNPNASQGSFPQEGAYNYQNTPPESFGTYPPGQAYPQGVYSGHVQPESMQQHLGAYPSQVLPQHYPADPNAPGWAYGARPPQGVPANVVYQPQGGPYRPFTPQPHLQQQWVDMEGLRTSTPQPGMSGYPLPPPQFVTAGGKVLPPSAARQCPNCSASFERNTDLNRHIRTNHTGVTPYSCHGCGSAYSRSDARGKHWKENPDCKRRHEEDNTA